MTKELESYRGRIDEIDTQIVDLFTQRMHLAKEVGIYKQENNLSLYDPDREQEIVEKAGGDAPAEMKGQAMLLMRTLMAFARGYQRENIYQQSEPLLPLPATPKREHVICAYQGVPGAWSEQASRKLFPEADLHPAEFFEDVFKIVKNNNADYGIVPIENSQSGAIGETYDLLRKYGCYVVGRTWIEIKQCLLGKPGLGIHDVRKVYSHPEGFRQCRRFLSDKYWERVTCSNTAVAARLVRDDADPGAAAIGSRLAGELNGLEVIRPDITDTSNNRTSFVVIGPKPEYDEESNLVSITFSLEHRSGSLCEALLPFTASGINLTRIESRPAPDGHYRFFAEMDGCITDPVVQSTLRQVESVAAYLEVIGCYKMI
ncbi:MAG: bifunctional chorismate mutase/prephenate dehydratase [Clostridiales Family XIII bacterium]|jgi:chorismate mutase/prephenate dehydratase|nr:bifunctional chorismate mutase/prephenate dehydratase [Clostridiales Family XIII bacterium]